MIREIQFVVLLPFIILTKNLENSLYGFSSILFGTYIILDWAFRVSKALFTLHWSDSARYPGLRDLWALLVPAKSLTKD